MGRRSFVALGVGLGWSGVYCAPALADGQDFAAGRGDEGPASETGSHLAGNGGAPLAVSPTLPAPTLNEAAGALDFVARDIQVTGATVIDAAKLDALVAPYRGQRLSTEDLSALRQSITLAYIDAGYFSSGAVINDQDVSDGVLEIEVIEGRIGQVNVHGLDRWRPGKPRPFLARAAFSPLKDKPLDGEAMATAFRALAASPNFKTVNGTVDPGGRPGVADITLDVEPARPYFAAVTLANDRSPAIGSERATLEGGLRNLIGLGDVLEAAISVTEGSTETAVSARVPIPPLRSTLRASGSYADSEVIAEPFSALDIFSEALSVSAGLEISPVDTPKWKIDLAADVVRVESESTLGDLDFSQAPGQRDGRIEYTAARATQTLQYRALRQTLVAQSTFTFGLDAIEPAAETEFTPPSDFSYWRGRLIHQLRTTRSGQRLLSEFDVQLSPDPLFPNEKFAVGGPASVQGYRVNSQVADGGALARLTYLFPATSLGAGPGSQVLGAAAEDVQIGITAATGTALNFNESLGDAVGLSSVGLTARWAVKDRLSFQLDAALGLSGDAQFEDETLQDYGVGLKLVWRV